MKIANRDIGKGHRPYIIAEMSGNHNGDITRAIELIKAAKDAGADAVKLQTYTADTITINHDSEEFMIVVVYGMDQNFMTCTSRHIPLGIGIRHCLMRQKSLGSLSLALHLIIQLSIS